MKKSYSIIFGVLLVAILILAGCGHPSQGMVYKKEYVPQSSYQIMVCSAYNKNGTCMVWMPIQQTDPECWKLLVKDETEKWDVCVDKETWDRTQIESTWKEAA